MSEILTATERVTVLIAQALLLACNIVAKANDCQCPYSLHKFCPLAPEVPTSPEGCMDALGPDPDGCHPTARCWRLYFMYLAERMQKGATIGVTQPKLTREQTTENLRLMLDNMEGVGAYLELQGQAQTLTSAIKLLEQDGKDAEAMAKLREHELAVSPGETDGADWFACLRFRFYDHRQEASDPAEAILRAAAKIEAEQESEAAHDPNPH